MLQFQLRALLSTAMACMPPPPATPAAMKHGHAAAAATALAALEALQVAVALLRSELDDVRHAAAHALRWVAPAHYPLLYGRSGDCYFLFPGGRAIHYRASGHRTGARPSRR